MRLKKGLLLVLFVFSERSALAQLDPVTELPAHLEEFAQESEDLERINAERVAREDALSWIKLLALFCFILPVFIIFLAKFPRSYGSETWRRSSSLKQEWKRRAGKTGQGADCDPYSGRGNDPV